MKPNDVQRSSLLFFVVLALLFTTSAIASWDDGVAAFKAGRYQEAASAFQAVTRVQPEQPQGHYMLGMSLVQQGQHQAALDPLRKSVELDSSNAQAKLLLAHAELQTSRGEAALEILSSLDAKALPSRQADQYAGLVAQAGMESKSSAALASLKKATTQLPDSKLLWTALGQVAKQRNQLEDAHQAFIRAHELEPSDDSALQVIGAAINLAKKAKETSGDPAIWYAKAGTVALGLTDSELTFDGQSLVAQALLMAGKYPEARRQFTELASQQPTQPSHVYHLASCDLAEMESQSALANVDKALTLKPDPELTQRLYVARGKALRQLERFDEAAKAFERAGKSQKVDEMRQLALAKTGNEAWEKDRQECLRRQSKAERLRKDGEMLQGTPAWAELEGQINALTAGCENYLKPEST